jgi:hypothetical protein
MSKVMSSHRVGGDVVDSQLVIPDYFYHLDVFQRDYFCAVRRVH